MKQYYSRTCYDIYLFLHIKCYKDVSNSFSPFQSSSSEITKANSATESIDTNLLYVYSQIHRHIYFYMGFPPLCHFWGLLQKWIYITFCFTICPFHLIDEGHASRSIHVVLIFFFPLGVVRYSEAQDFMQSFFYWWTFNIFSVFTKAKLEGSHCENNFWPWI